jgi:glucan biosynthesis protein C
MKQTRIFFLDNLRAFVVFLVVVLHGSLTYMAYGPEWWYVVDPNNSLFFTALVLLVDVPIMLVMFFIAGYFAYPSLAKRGPRAFVNDKSTRIGQPWIVGSLLLAPPTAYMIYYSRGVPMSFWQFWATDFWGPVYQQSVYWFLGILFLFFVLMAIIFTASNLFRNLTPVATSPSWRLFVGFAGIMTAGFLALNFVFPLDTWSHNYIFVFQPLRVPLYIGYFILGVVAFQQRWFTENGYRPGWGWFPWFLVSGLMYVGYRFSIPGPAQTTFILKAGNALLFNLFCLSSLMFGAAIFQRYVNGNNPFWRSQARNSYGIYYIHPLILYPLAYLFIPIALPVYLKAVVVIGGGWLLSWGFSALILTRLPWLRRIF